MTAPTNGMVLQFISTVTNSVVMVVIAPTVAEVATVKRVGQKTAKALASLTMSTKRGLATPTVMMVLMFQRITDAPNAQQVLQYG